MLAKDIEARQTHRLLLRRVGRWSVENSVRDCYHEGL